MAIGLPNIRNLVFDRESMGDLGSLGIDLSNLPTIDPGTVTKMPATTTTGAPGSAWWQDAGYPDAATAIQSGNFKYNMNTGWQLKPGAETPAMKLAAATTPESAFVAPSEVVQSAIENLPVTIGAMTSPDLGPLGTSGMSVFEDEPITMTSDSTSPMSPMVEPEVTSMDSDIDRMVERALKEAMASGDVPVQAADDPILTIDPVIETVDPVQAAVDAAVGNGQPTTDDTILDTDTTDTTDTTETQQPDFMTQLQELIAQMQAEQTAAAEAQAAAEAAQQQQVAEMTQNYMVGQPAVGYNPYQSGQYQNNPYGAAGVPNMGGITSIPVPAAYTPNPYLIGGTT